MCGIFVIVYKISNKETAERVIGTVLEKLKRRGHDSVISKSYNVKDDIVVHVIGCVLHLRGDLTPQPLESDNHNWLLWNGEVFGGQSILVGDHDNDTRAVLQALTCCHSNNDAILGTLSGIHGPWSMIYWEQCTHSLWIGRDVLGRRSLLWHLPQDNDDILALSSVGTCDFGYDYWSEVPAVGIYQYLIQGHLHCYPWREKDTGLFFIPNALEHISLLTTSVKVDIAGQSLSVPFGPLNTTSQQVESDEIIANVKRLLVLIEEAVKRRLVLPNPSNTIGANVGILFSGGLDSAVLAALTDRCLDPEEEIDLINVAFDQSKTNDKVNFEVPDRITALQTLSELNPARKWNLVLVNVVHDEVVSMRNTHISNCIYPLTTVLDDSLGCAMWFAARGQGIISGDIPYTSSAKILLVGVGADEQLAGYARHRTQYKLKGLDGLLSEVEHDIKRISSRNLGRDDRCIADHNKEARFPYLDEQVVDFLNSLPMQYKANLDLPRGQGEKWLLREVAILLGCTSAAGLPKRAIQFGSRMSSLSGKHNKGNDTSPDLIQH